MKPTLNKKSLIALWGLVNLAAAPAVNASLVLTFADSGASAALPGACSSIAWTAGAEVRFCHPGNFLSSGAPLQKDGIIGGETWTFNNSNQMIGVNGTPGNPGATYPGSAAPGAGTNPSLLQAVPAYGPLFYFLAPTLGGLAGGAYGPGMYMGGVPTNGAHSNFVHFNVLEGQWGGVFFQLGANGGAGIDFSATITGTSTVGNITTFAFEMFANEFVNNSEDPALAGWPTGETVQWHLTGSGVYTAAVPAPAAVWLFGSGLLGLMGAAYRKRKTT